MTLKATPGEGTITITLDGNKVNLVPSYRAAIEISKQANGISHAATIVQAHGLDVMAIVVKEAALLEHMTVDDVGQMLYRNGINNYVVDICTYLVRLANAGKDPEKLAEKNVKTPKGTG